MKKPALIVAALMIAATCSFAQRKGDRTFRGQIMDAMCAANGSHSPGGYAATHTNDPKDCTLACVKSGSKFVLYNAGRKTILQLDDQDKARDFAGQNVRAVGTFDKATKTIHVEKIEAGS